MPVSDRLHWGATNKSFTGVINAPTTATGQKSLAESTALPSVGEINIAANDFAWDSTESTVVFMCGAEWVFIRLTNTGR